MRKRSKFNLSSRSPFTCDMGKLIPINWLEVLPGDTVRGSSAMLVRASPLVAPVMHPVLIRIHHWFVPNRLIWEDFPDFITGGEDGDDDTEPPYITLSTCNEGTIFDYMGIPVGSYSGGMDFSALPFRAYNLIVNENYRDQDLVDELTVSETNGYEANTNFEIFNCAWPKDYLTTARPFEQKGTGVTVPIGDTADIIGDGAPDMQPSGGTVRNLVATNGNNSVTLSGDPNATGNLHWNDPALLADLSSATGLSINDWRLALAVQRFMENAAHGGSRYSEYLSRLGVQSNDYRLANPEYLGGGRQTIQFSEVLQTAEGTDPVGEMKGHGIAALRTNSFQKFFQEHGILMSLMSAVPVPIYTQNVPRKWTRTTKEHYYQKELQHIGDQQVLNKEAYAFHSSPDDVFGYAPRYDEYRKGDSHISGEFNSTLNHWHMGRVHSSDIALNESFIECNPTKRVFASTNTDCLYCDCKNTVVARRLLNPVATQKTF
jgi:hypothetical protein